MTETLLSLLAGVSGSTKTVGLTVDFDGASTMTFRMATDKKTEPKNLSITAVKVSSVGGGVTRSFELDLGDADTKDSFADAGLLGAGFSTAAQLSSVRVVSRERGQSGDWNSEAPCFEVHVCWNLNVTGTDAIELPDGGEVAGSASVAAEVCVGLGVIRPDWAGLSNFEVRVDAPGLGLSTRWLPLALLADFDGIDLPELQLDPLVAWFAKLLDVEFSAFDLPELDLPDWSLDLPAVLDLPLGVGVETTRLWVRKVGGGLVLDAVAEGFYLTWDDEAVTDPGGKLSITYSEASDQYTVIAELVRRSWPPAGTPDGTTFGFALPFDALAVTAEAWFLSLGVHLDDPKAGGRLCFRALVEVGGMEIRVGGRGLWRTDLRLLLLDGSVIANSTAQMPAKDLFAGLPGLPFNKWVGKPIPAQSFARDLRDPGQTAPANDYGLTFIDGLFQSGERIYLLWQMSGERLVRALAHDLLGHAPAGSIGAAEGLTTYALEWLREADGGWQVRLDWRGQGAGSVFSGAKAPVQKVEGNCVVFGDKAPDLALSLPLGASPGVALDGSFERALTLDLPGVKLEAAPSRDQALIFGLSPDGDWSVSHLLLFHQPPVAKPAGSGDPPPAPLLRARVGFAVGGEGGKSVAETAPVAGTAGDAADGTFLTLAAGPLDTTKPVALRSIGWRKGRSPRFLQVPRNPSAKIVSLIPDQLTPVSGTIVTCPGPPLALPVPGVIRFDDFGGIDLGNRWGLSVRVAAQNALLKMFGGAGSQGDRLSFEIEKICEDPSDRKDLLIHTTLMVKLGTSNKLTGTAVFRFDLGALSIRTDGDVRLDLEVRVDKTPPWASVVKLGKTAGDYLYSTPLELLAGTTMTAMRPKTKDEAEAEPATLPVLSLDLSGGRFVLRAPKEIDLLLQVTVGAGIDEAVDGPLVFRIGSFAFGSGGLDLEADLLTKSLQLPGLTTPVALTGARLRILGGRLDLLEIQGASTLPAILDHAPVKVGVVFGQEEGGAIKLKALKAELGDRGKPILSRGTRFRFEIEELDLIYREGAGAWFEITGSAAFTPDPGEFSSGLLEKLKSVTLSFTRLRVGDDVLSKVVLMCELNAPIKVGLFGLFEMEIRSIGLHPRYPDFDEPAAAVLIGGQIRFAEAGDVVQAQVDFHRLAVGMPRSGSALPQVHAKGLRVVISSPEGFKIGGRVDSLDEENLKGFRGEGVVQVPGLPELSAAFAFVRVRDPKSDTWKKAWFIAIEAAKISYLVGGALPIYLRQVGLGFGYRYTLPLIEEFSKETDPADLIEKMLAALDAHQTLARIDSWQVDADDGGRKWTIALEAVLSLGTTQPTPFDYDARAERRMRTIFAQFLAAYRSDFTMVAAAKVWFPVSIDDFFENREGMRARPLAKGFIAYSAPQRRLLAHARKSANPYLGPSDEAPFPQVLKAALDSVDYDVTLLVEPGLVHAELGWPDRLHWGLKVGPLSVGCRGGILVRLQDDILIYGYYFSAYGELVLSGGVDAGVVGLQIEARVSVTYATRLLIGADTRKPLDSHLYGAIGLDLSVKFSVRAWLRIKLKFVRITIRISFSFSLQLTVLGEIGWAGQGNLGFRGRATLSISVFGRSLGIKVDVGINKSEVDKARIALQKYAASILEPGKAPVFPGLAEDRVLQGGSFGGGIAKLAGAGITPESVAGAVQRLEKDDFVLALRRGREFALTQGTGDDAKVERHVLHFVWIMPGPSGQAFYPVPMDPEKLPAAGEARSDLSVDYATLNWPNDLEDHEVFVPGEGGWEKAGKKEAKLVAYPLRAMRTDEPEGDPDETIRELKLAQLVAAGHEPAWQGPEEDEKAALEDFPSNWPMNGLVLTVPDGVKAPDPERDARVFDPASAARTMQRTLDPGDSWDSKLGWTAKTIDPDKSSKEMETEERAETARANQALLLQAFHDDLCRIAALTRWDLAGKPVTEGLDQGRPTLADLGMVLCLKTKAGAPLPDWVAKRNAINAPTVTFTDHAKLPHAGDLRPAITAEIADFAANPPRVDAAASFYDETNLAVAWEMTWGARTPGMEDLPDDALKNVEAFIESYDILVVDATGGRILHQDRVTHADTVVEQGRKRVALRPRFGFSMPSANLRARANDSALPRSVIISVTPNGHSGTRGEVFSFAVDHVPVRTPLAPADAEARLTFKAKSKTNPEGWSLRVTWRKPPLPVDGSAAETRGWRLVLRPLAEVPLGAYPEAAGDATDRGRMGATAHALQSGDILVALKSGMTEGDAPSIKVPLGDNYALFDSLGRRLADDDPHHGLAKGFLDRRSVAATGGRAWRLFLQSGPVPEPGQWNDATVLPEGPVSGLAAVQLLLDMPEQAARPLPHLEWPDRLDGPDGLYRWVAVEDLSAHSGAVLVPTVTASDGAVEFAFDDLSRTARAVDLAWNLLPSERTAPLFEPSAVAAFAVYEWRLDDLVNRDLAVAPDYGLLRRVVPVEAARAREIPASMRETQLWEAQYPVSLDVAEDSGLHWLEWKAVEALENSDDRERAERGAALARRPIHADLALILGRLAGNAPDLQVEILDGPPVTAGGPRDWMATTDAAVDPYGWAALSDLGLCVQLAARHRVTGEVQDQGRLVALLQAVIGVDADVMIELPVQHAQAYRARTGTALPADIGLGMVQVGLRPRPGGESPKVVPPEWIDLVSRALARAEPGAPDLAASAMKDRDRLVAEMTADPDLLPLFIEWASRFVRHAGGGTGGAGRFAAAQMRAADPLLVAADGAGTLRMTCLVDEQWATRRRYAIRREGRYDRLYAQVAPEKVVRPEVPEAGSPSVDAYLPRVRALELPAVSYLGTWQDAAGRPFHDIVLSHVEDALSDRNWSVRGRMEFGDIARSYDRAFAEPDFVRLLKGGDGAGPSLLAGAELSGAVTVMQAAALVPTGTRGEELLLGRVPSARWGARRYRDAAEPFYYRQRVRLMVTAGDTVREMTGPLALPGQEAGPAVPLGGKATLRWDPEKVALSFPAPGVPGLVWTEVQEDVRVQRAETWAGLVGTDLASWFKSDRPRLEVRLPRYAENLPVGLRGSVFPHETTTYPGEDGTKRAPAGLLPDAEARLLVVRRDAGTSTLEPLVQVTPVRKIDDQASEVPPAFTVAAVSSAVAFEAVTVGPDSGQDWTDGLWVGGDLRALHPGAFVRTGLSGLNEITGIHLADDATSVPADALPQDRPLVCLAALALRLVVEPAAAVGAERWVGLLTPPAAPIRGILRPHLWGGSGAAMPGDAGDLAVALRLLLDPRRRARLDEATGATDLMREIEEAAVFWQTPVGAWLAGSVTPAKVEDWAKSGLRLWCRRDTGAVAISDDPATEVPKLGGTDQVLVLVRRLAPEPEAGAWTADVLADLSGPDVFPPVTGDSQDVAGSAGLTDLAERIARGAYRPRGWQRPEVDVLRGNKAPQVWGREEDAP